MKRTVHVIPDYVTTTKRSKTTKNKRKQYIPTKISGGPLFDPTPNSIKVRMRYCKYVDLTSNLDPQDFTYHAFRANSVWDPDYTGTGHKALGMDIYSDMYSKYRVLKSYIKVTPASVTYNGIYFVHKTPRNIIESTTTETLLEKKETRYDSLRDTDRTVSNYFNMKEDKSIDQEPWTSMGGNPTHDWYFMVGHNSNSAGGYVVELVYDVELSDRKPIISG